MNATQTAILEALATDPFTVSDLVEQIGKSETTIRKNLKDLETEGKVRKDGTHWFLVEVDEHTAEQHAYTKLMDDTEVEDEVAAAAEIEAEVVEDQPAEAPAPKKYIRHETPTTRTVRTNQITGAEVQVIKQGELPRDHFPFTLSEKWGTVCLTHQHVAGFPKVLDAHYASSYPTFCPECATKIPAEAIGRRRRGTTAN